MHYNLCDMIADITQNAVEAGASYIKLECIQTSDFLSVTVEDNGKGMSPEVLACAKNPFFTDGRKHPNRKVGLGIPFLIQTTEQTGGFWDIQSAPGKGTTVSMKFNLMNIDTPPIGDFPELFRELLTLSGSYDMDIHRQKRIANLDYRLNRNELRSVLGGELNSAGSQILLQKYIASQENQ